MKLRRRDMMVLALGLLLPAVAMAQAPALQVEHAWARATPGGLRSGAVYLTLRNAGVPDRLTGAATPLADMAMLHESYDDHGIARMRMLDGVALPAGGSVVLRPGGIHIMLTGLHQPLVRGSTFPLMLSFAAAKPVTVTVRVLAAGAAGPADGDSMPGMKMP